MQGLADAIGNDNSVSPVVRGLVISIMLVLSSLGGLVYKYGAEITERTEKRYTSDDARIHQKYDEREREELKAYLLERIEFEKERRLALTEKVVTHHTGHAPEGFLTGIQSALTELRKRVREVERIQDRQGN